MTDTTTVAMIPERKKRCHSHLPDAEHKAWHKAYYLAHREHARASARARYQANRTIRLEQRRGNRLKQLYGISVTDYGALFKTQRGRCAICRAARNRPRLSVDHDHKTGRVRGLLCYSCNIRLGQLETKWHGLALAYLAAHDRRALRA